MADRLKREYGVTRWYPFWVKPERVGLYEIGSDFLSVLCSWDGKWWVRADGKRLPDQEVCWRGLAREPKS